MSASVPAEVVLPAWQIDTIAARVVASQPAAKRDHLAIFLPFVSALLGAMVSGGATYLATSTVEVEKQRSQLELATYSDFAKAQAAWFRSQQASPRATPQQVEAAALQIRDAAFRTILFSPVELVDKLAAFYRDIPREACTVSENDLAVYQIMRRQVLQTAAGDLSKASIAMVAFGCGVGH